ncbi:LLM class flavin-dependent oxidoreductase, partial [Streptomyces acidiscabies]|uniref:LLM class flavin-dependent oxidoreductase n=1 Tax=Streptomyces acidiscabies TaxID=42234 RepID=UPI000A5B1232
MPGTPLGILDLVPVPSGSTAADALRNSIDLARHAERLGYTRYWFAEHHLNPGVAGTSPAILLALTAAATATIRLGSGAVQLGHRTEWTKIRSVRSTMWTLGVFVVMVVGVGLLTALLIAANAGPD